MKCWVIGCDTMHRAMWQDVNRTDDAVYVDRVFSDDNKTRLFFKKKLIELGKKRMLPNILKRFAYSCFSINDLNFTGKDDYIILVDNRVGWYPMDYLEDMKKKWGLKYALIYLNPYALCGSEVKEFQKRADIVFSYDKNDAEKYGFERFISVYSSSFLDKYKEMKKEVKNDICYVGGEGGRLKEQLKIFSAIDKGNVSYDFTLVGVKETEQLYQNKINYSLPLAYENYLMREVQSNTILEILDQRHRGITLRTLEAVLLNKKLVTNNQNLVNLPFYNPNYMKIFQTPEEIDFEFIRKREEVHYEYHEECSPIRIIERIREHCDTMN